ncbi:MAG: hypothetical protein M0R51_12945 [Clostridia bacterium]|jgi:hypothetical protein|nr:hypothetical protein [Clostridia bacterium]
MKLAEIIKEIINAYENKTTIEIEIEGETPFDTAKINLSPFDIVSISEKILITEKSIVEQILECGDDIKKALMLASKIITPEEEKALDTLVFSKRRKNVINRIAQQIATTNANLTTESVLMFMCENILGLDEMPLNLTEKQETALIKEIDESIKKLENCNF